MLLSFYVILYRTAMAEAKGEVNKTRHFVAMIPLHVLNREVGIHHSHIQQTKLFLPCHVPDHAEACIASSYHPSRKLCYSHLQAPAHIDFLSQHRLPR